MTDRLRAAAQAVLKAWTGGVHPNMGDALRELRAALAEQAPCDMGDICIGCTPRRSDGGCPGAQKPAAWIREDTAITTDAYQAACWRDSHTVTPLYAEPPRREWQTLTDEEITEMWIDTLNEIALGRAIEAALKGKNHD